MGIRWVFENERTKTAFWLTFLLPFIGGYLSAGWWAILLVPAVLVGGLYVVAMSFIAAGLLAFGFCGGGMFEDCPPSWYESYLLTPVFIGLFAVQVIGWLAIFGAGAARFAQDPRAEMTTGVKRVSKSVRTPVRTQVRGCPGCSGKVMLSLFGYCKTCDGFGKFRK